MNERVRSVLTGLAAGIVPLLLVDLARILTDAVAADGGQTSPWWPIAAYLATGVVVASGAGAGRSDRLVPVIGAAVVLLALLAAVPWEPAAGFGALPLAPGTAAGRAVVAAVAGVYLYAAVRGPKR
ncbi:MAG: hypothetical protein ACNA8R_13390 [Nitriliruptoraceae bacterium]